MNIDDIHHNYIYIIIIYIHTLYKIFITFLVGGFKHFFIFHFIYGMSSFPLTNHQAMTNASPWSWTCGVPPQDREVQQRIANWKLTMLYYVLWSTKKILCIIMYNHVLCKSTINDYTWPFSIAIVELPEGYNHILCMGYIASIGVSSRHDNGHVTTSKDVPPYPRWTEAGRFDTSFIYCVYIVIYIYICMYILDNCVTVYLARGMTYYSWSFNWWLDHCKRISDKWLMFTYIPCHTIAFPAVHM